MNELEIVDVRHLFKEITKELILLLKQLDKKDWCLPTCYPDWKVKDIASHLLQTGIGRLSKQRDCFPTDEKHESLEFSDLIKIISNSNDSWADISRNISPKILFDLLIVIENQLAEFFITQDLMSDAFYAVTWAGENSSKNWFDIAREFTERWHHQQQIREAVSAPTLANKKYLSPVIDTLIRAVPFWYKSFDAAIKTRLGIIIHGDSGGSWTLTKSEAEWVLTSGIDGTVVNEMVELSDDTAWRFLTRSVLVDDIQNKITFSNDTYLCRRFLTVKAILIGD